MKGKQLQYHANIDKDVGRDLYRGFVAQVRGGGGDGRGAPAASSLSRLLRHAPVVVRTAQMTAAVQEVHPEGVVLHGTYGNTQRMKDVCNDGPYTHVLDF
jgi:hypothetical protein